MTARPAAPVMGATEWLLLLALAGLWGGSFFFARIATAELPTLTVVFGRVAPAALALLIVLRASGRALPRRGGAWGAFLAMGLLNNVIPFTLFFWGQPMIAAALAAILNATTPVFTVLLAHVLTRDEKLTAGKLAGVALGLAGVVVMIGPAALGGLGSAVAAQVACLGGALSYAVAGIYGRRFKALGVGATESATGQLTTSSLMVLPAWLVVDAPWTLAVPSAATLAAMAGLALLSTALGYVLYFRILAAAGATNLLLVTFLIPVSAFLLGFGVLGETLEGTHVFGMALIGLGLAAIDGRPLRRARRARRPA